MSKTAATNDAVSALRIVHVNTTVQGGAARAQQRLAAGLRELGHDAEAFVMRRPAAPYPPRTRTFLPDERVLATFNRNRRRKLIRKARAKYPKAVGPDAFSDDRTEYASEPAVQLHDKLLPADVVHLHWTSGFVDWQRFVPPMSVDVPLVWTAHDMEQFTGGCHYDAGCGRFALAAPACGKCPLLGSNDEDDLSRAVWQRKADALANLRPGRLHIVTASQWMADEARRSTLLGKLPIHAIPLGIDTNVFHPIDRAAARQVLGLPADARIVLFAADSVADPRKGFSHLRGALAGAATDLPGGKLLLASVGGNAPQLSDTSTPLAHLGYLVDDRMLAIAYSAADVFVLPSLQEAFGQTIIEAAACSTPAVGFATGGVPEVIRDGQTGLLAPVGDVAALRSAIVRLLSDDDLRHPMGQAARQNAVAAHGLRLMAERHVEIYRQAIAGTVAK